MIKNTELKFSIQNLIDTTKPSCENKEKGISTKRSELSTIPRPIPLLTPKIPHPCWSFLSQLQTKNSNGTIPLNSSLIFLSKMNQVWEQIQRTQISPSVTTTTTENDDVSDEDVYMDISSIHRHTELDDDDEEDEEEDEEEEGECSTSTGDKHNATSNSEENDKLKTYPCTHCGKVKSKSFILIQISILRRYLLLNII
jgi:hypothetical protein